MISKNINEKQITRFTYSFIVNNSNNFINSIRKKLI